jgi:hypothetical protein
LRLLAVTPPPELGPVMDGIEAEVEKLRGLEETTPITRTFLTREHLTDYLEFKTEAEYSAEEAAEDVRVLAAFDFVDEDIDLAALLVDLHSSQVVGLYSNEDDTLYLISEPVDGDLAQSFDLMTRLTFVHEYTHGLQDAHFDLNAFTDVEGLSDDEALARLSLVEGDATLVMTQYLLGHLAEVSAADLETLQGGTVEGSQEALTSAPSVLHETFLFPYLQGLDFAKALLQQGWQAVDAAFADPPRSTEQILHPEKYLAGDEPQIVTVPPLTDTLGVGWRLVEANTLGEFHTGFYLAQQVDQATADLASEGWDGDQYALYVRDDGDVLVFATAWDSPQDREEFVSAYAQYAGGKYHHPTTREDDMEQWWEMPSGTTVLAWGDTTALIILGPDPATVETVLAVIR